MTRTSWHNVGRLLTLLLACILLTACALSDGERQLVLIPSPFAKKVTGDICIDRPIEAYVGGVRCKTPIKVTSDVANAPLDVIRGGCALEYAIDPHRIGVFREFLAKGGKLKRCRGYPDGIYATLAYMCFFHPVEAHAFFETIEEQGTFQDEPQMLMWHATLNKCPEGVRVALRHGALPDRPAQKNWDHGFLRGRPAWSPLEGALASGWGDRVPPMIAVVTILVDAGASPWVKNVDGKPLYEEAEKHHGQNLYWPELKAALLHAPQGAIIRN